MLPPGGLWKCCIWVVSVSSHTHLVRYKNQMSNTSHKFLCVKKALVQLCLQYHYNAGDDREKPSQVCLQSLRSTAAFKFGLFLQVSFSIDDVKFDAPLELNLCDQCWVTNLHNAHCVVIISLEELWSCRCRIVFILIRRVRSWRGIGWGVFRCGAVTCGAAGSAKSSSNWCNGGVHSSSCGGFRCSHSWFEVWFSILYRDKICSIHAGLYETIKCYVNLYVFVISAEVICISRSNTILPVHVVVVVILLLGAVEVKVRTGEPS